MLMNTLSYTTFIQVFWDEADKYAKKSAYYRSSAPKEQWHTPRYLIFVLLWLMFVNFLK